MANTTSGFYAPGSISGSYVASKRTPEGSLYYPGAETDIGIQKQKVLQDLGKSYESTIENAYASYLASQQNVLGSQMGQGYKEQYLQSQQENLMKGLAETQANLANVRAELESKEAEAKSVVQSQYMQEVNYLDRVAKSFEDYLSYAKTLSGTDKKGQAISALSEEERQLGIDDLYETLYTLQPQGIEGLADEEGNAPMTWSQWLQTQLKGTAEDTAWKEWLYSGGIQDFLTSVRTRPGYKTSEQIIEEKQQQIEEEKLDSEIKTIVDTDIPELANKLKDLKDKERKSYGEGNIPQELLDLEQSYTELIAKKDTIDKAEFIKQFEALKTKINKYKTKATTTSENIRRGMII